MGKNAPIGVFDSGIGGLTVMKELIDLMPSENMIYVGDTGRIPYGSRPVEQIREFTNQMLDFLSGQGIKLAVIACNTITLWCLEQVRDRYPFPIVGMNTGEQLALSATANKHIGIVGTLATINSGKHAQRIKAADPAASVFPQACPALCPLVEREVLDGDEAAAACRECFLPVKEAGVDTLVLACTHYPFLMPLVRNVMGEAVTIIDPAKQTALDAYQALRQADLLADSNRQALRRFYFTADPQRAKRLAERIIDAPLHTFEQVNL